MTVIVPDWAERPKVPAVMLNPALTAAAIAACTNQYQETSGNAMPWSLCFLVVPLVLHTPTREALPTRSTTSLSSWVGRNPTLVAGFAVRAQQLAPYAREGVRFGLYEELLELVAPDQLRADFAGQPKPAKFGDVADIIRRSGMVGRVFARNSSTFSTFAALRVRP